ncbi:Serine hydrolase FSH [Elaphomyces granulatus]|jgi:hypothetical protein
MGTSSQIFEAQLSRIKDQLEGHHDFVFLQGEVETDPAPGIKEFYPGPYYTYFEVPTKCQVQEALELLEEFIEDEGPFDGVIAFSNGAAVAASYLLQDSKRPSPQHPFKCAVFFCASLPFDLDSIPFTSSVDGTYHLVGSAKPISSRQIFSSMPELQSNGICTEKWDRKTPLLWRYGTFQDYITGSIGIPSTHIFATNDITYREQSMLSQKLFQAQNREVVEHREGHDIPRDRNSTAKIQRSIQNMLRATLVG